MKKPPASSALLEKKLSDLKPDTRNANKGTARGAQMIKDSLRDYGAGRIFKHQWNGLIKASERGEKRCHPTQKPVALAVWCFEHYGKPKCSVLDLFGGSGSTLIACEKTGRKCFMMEISPAYCDVIVERWQNATGKKAVLAGG